jgi:hypothetical protein
MPVIPTTEEERLEDQEFKASLGKVKEPLSQKQNTNKRTETWLKW